ncbi:DUF6046 domain-containing protein [uncultured Tenacibaculum sp.]|uniref:DUF6046 domain-containing protein n=1 Tax=uncultured Tenacibaculum sp. TaxID=174713 RepID=UPI0026077056|nr:DUF6046 domain-containing protein [uncultured Tenacibaculum sp.]
MANTFNLKTLTAASHGYNTVPPFYLNKEALANRNKIGRFSSLKNHMGRPYFMDVFIDGERLPNEPLLTFSAQKQIVKTNIIGGEQKGSVKEIVNSSDFKIKIEGVCIEPGKKEYPTNQVEKIISLCQKQQAMDFENDLAELFGINKIIITSYNFDKMQGQPYSQRYTINAISDDDFYVELNNRGKLLSN